jgi:outer membrane lipoprotein carrier protein
MRRITVILGFCVCVAAASDNPIWVNLRSTYLKMKALSGTFAENICSQNQGTCTEFEARFAIALPGRYRIEVTDKMKQLFVSDGTTLWIYLPSMKQVVKRSGEGFAPVMAFLEPVLDSTTEVNIHKDSTGIYVAEVRTDDMSAVQDLVLELNETGSQINGFSFTDGMGQKIHFSFYDQSWNPELKPSMFTFTPPKGVTVDDQTAPAKPKR